MALGLARVRNWGREAQEGALALALARGRLTYQVRSAGRGAALDERLFPVASFNGVPRECVRNAGLLALSNPELTYVEGGCCSPRHPHCACLVRDSGGHSG